MYRIAICDDLAQDRNHIYNIATEVFDRLDIPAQLHVFDSPRTLLDDVSSCDSRYDLFLLDILMDDQNGMELAEALRRQGNRSRLIFITVSKDYALDGYRVSADDYLLKPLTMESLMNSVKRLIKERNIVAFKNLNGSVRLVSTDEIRWAEIYGHTVHVYTLNDSFVVRDTLDNLANILPSPYFVRCHRSYIINLNHVQELNKTKVMLADGHQLPISRRYSADVQQAVVAYTEESIVFL